MNGIAYAGGIAILSITFLMLIATFTGPPKCRDGFVPSWQIPQVGWVCLAGYRP